MNKNIEQVLGVEKKGAGRLALVSRYGIILLVLIGILAWWFWPGKNANHIQFQAVQVQKGDLTVSVTATGFLEPVNLVDIGTEISGTVKKVLVDFNDRVSAGQVLAFLDKDQLSAKLRQSQAALSLARAQVKEHEATVVETRSKLRRARDLAKKKLGTPEQVDTAQAAYARAIASLERAKAQVIQAQAQLDVDKTRLSKADIRSPINGIVVKREIEPGQTVAASLQTPILFTVAENLVQMELHVSVDEADVGIVKEGQNAIFLVDAYPQRSFPAKTTLVHVWPRTVEGVVTYNTVLSVNNADLSLRPGMTATAEIIIKRLENVLLVPNTALRFRPPVKTTKKKQPGLLGQLFSRRPRGTGKTVRKEEKKEKQYNVYILRDGQPVRVSVKIGSTDGQMTEITGGKLKPGMQVIVDTVMAAQ